MAGFWRLRRHWQQTGYRHFAHPHVVHVHFFSYPWLSYYCLHGAGFLDEHETLHPGCKKKPAAVFIVSSDNSIVSKARSKYSLFLPQGRLNLL